MNVVRDGRFRASVLNIIGERGGRPPLCPDQGVVDRPRRAVFYKIAKKDSVEEVEKRLKIEMKV